MGKFLAGLAIGLLLGVFGIGAFEIWSDLKQPDVPLPPLVAELPSNIDAASVAFDRRLKEQYSIGSPENRLISELWAEGFSPAPHNKDRERRAEYTRSTIPCMFEWEVLWAVDQDGNLAAIFGSHKATCS